MQRSTRRRLQASRPLLAALTVIPVIGLIEVAARAGEAPASATAGMMVPHPSRIWALQPGAFTLEGVAVRIGADGLREPAADGPADGGLILTVGDSSIFGHGVPDGAALHDQLQQQLPQSRVRSFAVPGYSILQSARLLEEQGWARRPRLLIIGNLWSDSDTDRFTDAALLAALDSPITRADRLLSGLALFRQLRLALNRLTGRPDHWRIGWPDAPDRAGKRRVPPAEYAAALHALLGRAAQDGAAALLLTLTSRWRMDQPGGASWEPYVRIREDTAASWSVPLLDAQTVFTASGLPPDALFIDGLHPTAEGHRILAAGLAAQISAMGWPGALPLPVRPSAPAPLPPEPPEPPPGDPASLQYRMLQQP